MLQEDRAGQPAHGVLVDPARLRSVERLGVGPRADAAFERIAGLVEQLIDAPMAVFTVIGADCQFLPGQVGLPQPLATTREMPLTHSFSRHVVESGRLVVVGDVREDSQMRGNPAIRDLGTTAFAGAPVTDPDGLVIGALAVMDREPRQWTKSEITLLTDLAAVCSSEVGLRIARAIADEARAGAEEAHDQLRLLGELTEALTATMDIEAGMGRLGRMVAGRLADWCFVTLTDPTTTKIRHVSAAHSDPAYAIDALRLAQLVESSPRVVRLVLRSVQRTGRLIREDRADPGRPAVRAEIMEIAERMGFASYLLVPITAPVSRRVLGAMMLVNGAERGIFGADEEHVAAEIGRRAGLAVDNSRMYGRQRHVAEVLQHSMLTELPEIPGVELHARYLPAQAGDAVGGDWYDAFVQPDGSVMIAVGDVAGHDIEAAATMGQVRNLVRGDAYGRDDPPGRLLAQLDRALHGLRVPAAATAVLARVRRDGDGYELQFANAGHPPPILLRPDGEVEVWWETPEPLLGLMPRDGRPTHRRRVAPGSVLLLYTDGLVESPSRLIDDGIARLRSVLRNNPGLTGDDLCTQLIESAPRRADDIALLLVRLA
ncbi:SpoIIE family protein phosphatase [Actinoplanes sp. NPDC051343]|uniref:SpoIIE family protein phosphatase n=1 Tax=Actinoplanes sp. NPDC051343 TaxID=3363906 RepID=UPI0037B4ADF6